MVSLGMSTNQQTLPTQKPSTIQQTMTPAMEDYIRDQFTQIFQNMITISNELAFELSTIECEKWNTCPVCIKARELVKLVKKLWELQKQLPRPQPQPTTQSPYA